MTFDSEHTFMPSLLIKQIPERGLLQAWDIPGTGSLKWKKLGAEDGAQWKGTTSMCLPNTMTKYFLSDIPSSCFSKASCLPRGLVDLLEKKGICPWQGEGGSHYGAGISWVSPS